MASGLWPMQAASSAREGRGPVAHKCSRYLQHQAMLEALHLQRVQD
eukprot:CAMPEP_0204189740 /NCGR_PEP_ID=MMETSP0361-20130328/58737_1 /ASSEMBLY_ACC=CAM_ASM_000343 /TAXON_ID=268821 /ORGANISM="Scrippsiella Hangoei, Strain SHTV-5" /LENGTH=45 /DNA_ID= /DNA_START= /DNA_END= /DNA_ORIENTATION=